MDFHDILLCDICRQLLYRKSVIPLLSTIAHRLHQYMTTIDYFVASYGRYAASASGGNALARDVLSGILTLFATSFYEDIGTPLTNCRAHTTDASHITDSKYRYQWASTILAALSLLVAIPCVQLVRCDGRKADIALQRLHLLPSWSEDQRTVCFCIWSCQERREKSYRRRRRIAISRTAQVDLRPCVFVGIH